MLGFDNIQLKNWISLIVCGVDYFWILSFSVSPANKGC